MSEISSNILDDNTVNRLTATQTVSTPLCGEVILTTEISVNVPSHANVAIYMRSLNSRPHIASIDFAISTNHIFLKNFNSKSENKGNGRILLDAVYKCINVLQANRNTHIQYVCGELSFKDFEHWDKLIHMYSTFIPNSSMTIDGLPLDVFIDNMSAYSQTVTTFRIYL